MRHRRTHLLGRWAALVALLALTGCARAEAVVPGVPEPSPGSLVISAGNATGVYYAWSVELARQLRTSDPRLDVTVLASDGSLANLARLRLGQADLALSTVDATEPTPGDGVGPTPVDSLGADRAVPLRALGRIYDDYVQVVVRADSRLHSVADLAGLRVAVNTPSSGTALVAGRVLDAAGITVRERGLGVADGTRALEEGRVDAVFWSGGIPTPSIAAAAERTPLRLLPLGELAGRLRADYGGVYRPATIPRGRYRGSDEVATVASPNLLVARADADPGMVRAVLTTVFGRRDAIADAVPAANGTDVRTAIWTGSLPLHPAAIDFYRRTKP
jgi:uncharacterized protein